MRIELDNYDLLAKFVATNYYVQRAIDELHWII